MVDSSSTYVYDPRTRLYAQPTYAMQTLRRFLSVNKTILSQLKTTHEISFERRAAIAAGTGLVDVIDLAIRDSSLAPTIAEAVLQELGQQTQ
jgi:small subunit ribosomal protein S29